MSHQTAQDYWELQAEQWAAVKRAYQVAFPGHEIPSGSPFRGPKTLMLEALRTGVPCPDDTPPPGAIY